MKVHVVIPIGVSTPGTPVMDLLRRSVRSVKEQTYRDFSLTVASDENVSEECKQFLLSENIDIDWYSPASFFRRGGIWKKISESWKKRESDYVAFLHYDDLWDSRKLEFQVPFMDKKALNSSWSETYVIDDNGRVVSGDLASWEKLAPQNVGSRTVALAHSCVVRKSSFFESGIMQYEDSWSPVFEDLFSLHLHVMGKGEKAVNSKFYWRNHTMNMTNSMFSDPRWKSLMEEQRIVAEYSDSEVNDDLRKLHAAMNEIAKRLR